MVHTLRVVPEALDHGCQLLLVQLLVSIIVAVISLSPGPKVLFHGERDCHNDTKRS